MKKIKRYIILSLAVVLFAPLIISGQTTDCSSSYERALLIYNKGMADSALRILQPCLENKRNLNNLSDRTKGRIFRLAALSSIMTDNPVDAEKYVRRMLEYQPNYKNNNNEGDLMEFRLMLDRISAIPSLKVCITGGIIIPFSNITKQYSDYPGYAGGSSLGSGIGYLFGISCEMMVAKRLSLEIGAATESNYFKYSIHEENAGQITYNQNIKSIEIPLLTRYYLSCARFRPYLELGINGRIFVNSSYKSDTYGKYWLSNSSKGDKILATFISDFEYLNLLAGAGAAYDFKKYSIRFDARYNQSFRNKKLISKFDNINGYSDISPNEKFYYTDDISIISFRNIAVSFGFVYYLRYRVF
jgi:outer membrane protein W